MKLFKPVYYKENIIWTILLPPEHRPNSARSFHDDIPVIGKFIPRTATSFILVDAQVLEGNPNWFEWQGRKFPKAWCGRGSFQKTRVHYQCPLTREIFGGIYKSWTDIDGHAFRTGPRISDDLENGPGFVYVNKFPGPDCFTFGSKHI